MNRKNRHPSSQQPEHNCISPTDITHLNDEALFIARLQKVIQKAQCDKTYLQDLKDNPIKTMNEAKLQLISGITFKVINADNDAIKNKQTVPVVMKEKNGFVLLIPPRVNKLAQDVLKNASGGRLSIPTINKALKKK